MKRTNLIYVILAAAISLMFSGCETVKKESAKNINFQVRVSELSYNFARVTVKHDGPEDVTWYGFITEDVTSNEFDLFYEKYSELLTTGQMPKIWRETERNILLENLKEETSYKYMVFGLKENGELYENAGIGAIEFKTNRNIYILTETEDWEIRRLGRSADNTQELIEVKAKKGGRFGWNYVSKEAIEKWNKENPDGYELWEDGIYMTTVNAIQMFALGEISKIQYYISNGYNLTDLTYIHEEGKPFQIDRLASGDYYLVAYGFRGDGNHTQTYSVMELKIEEETAAPGYEKWLGNYIFTGEADVTEDNGDIVRKEVSYNIRIEHFDNNHMYRIHGWECGEDVRYDWEKDIMQLDKEKDEFLAFPAYFRNDSLVVKETPMTYITFDGRTSLVLGMYGYAYNTEYNQEIPVILDDTVMAIAAPIAAGADTTSLAGQHGIYTQGSKKTEWNYCKMGYLARNESTGAYQTVNPAMRFPIKIQKVPDDVSGGTAGGATQTAGSVKTFSTKTIYEDFLKKDFSRLEKVKPEIFERQL